MHENSYLQPQTYPVLRRSGNCRMHHNVNVLSKCYRANYNTCPLTPTSQRIWME